MKRFSQLCLVLCSALIVVVFVAQPPQAQAQGEEQGTNLQIVPLNLEVQWPVLPSFESSLNELVQSKISLRSLIIFIYTLLLWISVLCAFGAIVYAGFLYIISGASPEQRRQAFDYIKRILKGGGILLLAVLILSFINNDLTDSNITGVNEVLCSGTGNPEACRTRLQSIRESGVGYFDIGGEEFRYAIQTTGSTQIQKRLTNIAQEEIEEKWDSAPTHLSRYLSQDELIDRGICAESINKPMCRTECKSNNPKCPVQQDCDERGDCSTRKNNYRKYDMNDNGVFDEQDVTSKISLSTFLKQYCIHEATNSASSKTAKTRDTQKSKQCQWKKLHELIEQDMEEQTNLSLYTNYDIDNPDVKLLYVIREDDDIAPSCAARCLYTYDGCPGGEITIPDNPDDENLQCNWGVQYGEDDDKNQEEGDTLQFSQKQHTNNAHICKIEAGINDDDFKDNDTGQARARCASQYILDSFDVPLVKDTVRTYFYETPWVIGIDASEQGELTACYCVNPALIDDP